MKQTLAQKKVHKVITSFTKFKGDYVQQGKYIEEIINKDSIEDIEELKIPADVALELLSFIVDYIEDGFKAPEVKVQLLAELFWG